MEKTNRTVDREVFIEMFEDDIREFAYEELEENYDWFDGYPDRSDSTKVEIVRERFDDFVDMFADLLEWRLI